MAIRWKVVQSKFSSGEYVFSGVVPVGHAGWNNMRSRGDGAEDRYAWSLELPGDRRSGVCATMEEARAATEAAFAEWCRDARLCEYFDE